MPPESVTPSAQHPNPRLIADVGGTFARFVLEIAPGDYRHAATLRCADHLDFEAAVKAYLATVPGQDVRHAAVAIANPVAGDFVRMTNYHWQFSIEQTRRSVGLDTLVVVNDFTALAMAIPRLGARDVRQIGGGSAQPRSVMGILGSGSGLGVSGLIPAEHGWISLGSEGGHASFSPRDEREIAVLRYALKRYEHVSFERFLSGPGIELLREALAADANIRISPMSAPEITQHGIAGTDELCVATLETFCGLLGTAAANLALTLGALGGIYIGGAIVPRLGEYFDRSPFRGRFEAKGRFSAYLADIPTFVITAENATFIGVSAILEAQLSNLRVAPGSAVLEQIRRAKESLSKAELKVADYVLAHPHAVVNDPITEIARAADVSQPTVIRFCRSLGCEGLSDFKLRLASGLTGTIPVTHTLVSDDDSMVELGSKVLGNTASAILELRSRLNGQSFDRALSALQAAHRVEFFAVGHYGAVAQDAQFKLLRLGKASAAHVDPRLMVLSSRMLKPGDVAVVISSSGRLAELLTVCDQAQKSGTTVIAITAGQSALARKADIALLVDHVEDVATHLPMISRILHLLIIDILSVGLTLRAASPAAATADEQLDEAAPLRALDLRDSEAKTAAPGVSTASPMTHHRSPTR